MVLAVKEILSRIDKGYYPMQMQNSYVLQGEVLLEFRFLEERYELIKSTVLRTLIPIPPSSITISTGMPGC